MERLARLRYFNPAKATQYIPFCDEFGPVNIASVIDFVQMLQDEIQAFPDSKIVGGRDDR
jgi:hypothetical protein